MLRECTDVTYRPACIWQFYKGCIDQLLAQNKTSKYSTNSHIKEYYLSKTKYIVLLIVLNPLIKCIQLWIHISFYIALLDNA